MSGVPIRSGANGGMVSKSMLAIALAGISFAQVGPIEEPESAAADSEFQYEEVTVIDFEGLSVTATRPSPAMRLIMDQRPDDLGLCEQLSQGDTLFVDATIETAKRTGTPSAVGGPKWNLNSCIFNPAGGFWTPYELQLFVRKRAHVLRDRPKRRCRCIGLVSGSPGAGPLSHTAKGACAASEVCFETSSFTLEAAKRSPEPTLLFQISERFQEEINQVYRQHGVSAPFCRSKLEHDRFEQLRTACDRGDGKNWTTTRNIEPKCRAMSRYCRSYLPQLEVFTASGGVLVASEVAELGDPHIGAVIWEPDPAEESGRRRKD